MARYRGDRHAQRMSRKQVTHKPEDDANPKLRKPAQRKEGATNKVKKSDKAYREKRSNAKGSFDQYCQRVLKLRDRMQVTPPSDSGPFPGLYIVRLSEECRMTKEEGRTCIKTVPRDKAALAEALNLRNPIKLGIPDDKDFIVLAHDDTVVARMYRNKLSEEEAEAWNILRDYFDRNSTGWAGSCEAVPHVLPDRLESQLRSKKAATSIGIADKMVIESVGPKKEGAATGLMAFSLLNMAQEMLSYSPEIFRTESPT